MRDELLQILALTDHVHDVDDNRRHAVRPPVGNRDSFLRGLGA